jgi:hypothetical protein
VLIPFLPPERRDINRRALPFRDVAENLRVDLELAHKEIDNPNFSLADSEIREVREDEDDHGGIFGALALVDVGGAGGNQRVKLAEAVGHRAPVEARLEFA